MPVLTEELARIKGHRWQISSLSFSPDGSSLASAGWDKEVNVWDTSNLELRLNLKDVHKSPITTVSWHRPGGLLLCTGSADNKVALWSAEDGRHMSTLWDHSGWVLGSCFSATGSLATASWDKTVRIWDPGSETLINTLRGHQSGVWSVDYHPRSSMLCTASEDGTVMIWDARSNRKVRTLSGGHTGGVYTAKWSPDGAMIASGSADSKICVWEPGKGAVINTIYGHMDTVKSVAFNPNTDNVALPVLASAGDFTVRLSDPRPSQKADILVLAPHLRGKEVEAVVISPDGSLMVSGGRDGIVVIMTLFVPSVMPRSETNQSTSSILRKSRVIRERSYLYDITSDDEIPEELDEEVEMQAEQEAYDLDQILASPGRAVRRPTSYTRIKRRSRFAEKDTALPDHATVRRKGVNAKASRAKRTKEKAVDIPTMVAHLSAAIRAYGPEEPSSSDSEDETKKDPSQEIPGEQVDVLSKVISFSHPESLSDPQQKGKIRRPSIDLIGKLSRDKFEKSLEAVREEDKEDGERVELEYLSNFDALADDVLREAGLLQQDLSLEESSEFATGGYTVGEPDYYNTSLRLEDFGMKRLDDDIVLTSSAAPRGNKKQRGFRPTLPAAEEEEGEEWEEEGEGEEEEEEDEDDVISMI